MARTIKIDINGTDYAARILPRDETWEPAARRAIQRKFGRGADVWNWTMDARQVDRDGNTVRVEYKGTIVGKRERHGGGYPVLAEARVWLAAS